MGKYSCHPGHQHPVGKKPCSNPGVSPAQTQPAGPQGLGPQAWGPQGLGPQAVSPGMPPTGVPTNVAPTRRIVHPTQYNQRDRVTRYPIVNVHPSHTRNVHHHVCEYHNEYPHTESHQDCYYNITCPSPRPPRRRPW